MVDGLKLNMIDSWKVYKDTGVIGSVSKKLLKLEL